MQVNEKTDMWKWDKYIYSAKKWEVKSGKGMQNVCFLTLKKERF